VARRLRGKLDTRLERAERHIHSTDAG